MQNRKRVSDGMGGLNRSQQPLFPEGVLQGKADEVKPDDEEHQTGFYIGIWRNN